MRIEFRHRVVVFVGRNVVFVGYLRKFTLIVGIDYDGIINCCDSVFINAIFCNDIVPDKIGNTNYMVRCLG